MNGNASRISICLISLLITATTFAQNNRSAVSVNGSDANSCTTISPCRSFTVAMAHTNAGGEVIAFDSGGYGPFTINKSVSVIGAPGVYGALTATSGDGIDVSAGAGDSIRIRNLNITLTTVGLGYGIKATTFGALSIENCSLTGGYTGISISGDAASLATLVDTAVRAASVGYLITSRAALVRCRAEKIGSTGLIAAEGTSADGIVSAVDFVGMGNGYGAGASDLTAGHSTFLSLDHALISHNSADGVFSNNGNTMGAAASVRVTNSTVTDNGGYGLNQQGGGTFGSMNNNLVAGNTPSDTNGTISLITAH